MLRKGEHFLLSISSIKNYRTHTHTLISNYYDKLINKKKFNLTILILLLIRNKNNYTPSANIV